jgi:class I lanthipeptide synthase
MQPTPAIELALEAARGGASVAELVAALEAAGTAGGGARDVVQRLIASDLLVAAAQVCTTGPEPSTQAVQALASLPRSEKYAKAVDRAIDAVSSATRIGAEVIDAVAGAFASCGVEVNRRRCLHVDARRPGQVHLPQRVLTEMRRSIDLLARITPPQPNALDSFKDAFERRFATRSVPLLEALDPDFGIRLASDGLASARTSVGTEADAVKRRRVLLDLIDRGRATSQAVQLSDRDVMALSRERPAVLPEAFGMLTWLIGRDETAVQAGEFRLVEPTVSGPSGVRLLGRLCGADPGLEGHVREHVRREAELWGDAVLAELSVAPETEAGLNITQRPVLGDWEIEYGGGSGAASERRLAASDLLVWVEEGEVVLRSMRLGRRVIPSCTTAMNSLWVSLPAARFLLSIAHQRITGELGWSWDELADAPALPRVTHGRTILSLRRWNVAAAELGDVGAGTDAAGFRRLQDWRRRRGIPRLVSFDHPKNRLLVDFGNVLSVDAFLAGTRDVDPVRFVEASASEPSPVHGPDGHYAHELIVPFTLDRASAPRARRRRTTRPPSESRRRFAPGTEWLYANLYGPVAAADRVLVDCIGPLARRLREASVVDRWFFVRYADPGRHLRVRFHGRPGCFATACRRSTRQRRRRWLRDCCTGSHWIPMSARWSGTAEARASS